MRRAHPLVHMTKRRTSGVRWDPWGPLIVIDDEARLIAAMRRAKAGGSGLDQDLLESMRALVGEYVSATICLHPDAHAETLSAGCETLDLSISTDA